MNSIEKAQKQIEALTPEKRAELFKQLEHQLKDLKFIPNAGPQTDAYFSPADELLYGGAAGCTSGDTEFLTEQGWKRIDQWSGEQVGQIDKDMSLSFVKPDDYIDAPCSEMIKFSSRKVSMVLSEDHRMPLYDRDNKFTIKTAKEVERHPSRHKVPVNYSVSTEGIDISDDMLRLAVAIHADGNLTYRKDGGAYCRISLRKERKIERLLDLFDRLSITPHEYRNPNRPTEIRYGFDSPVLTKTFEGDWWKANQRQLEIILDEMNYWDGAYSGAKGGDIYYSSTNECDVDFIQYVAHACGRVATISAYEKGGNSKTSYKVNISKDGSLKGCVTLRGDNTKIERVNVDRMYCFTLPTGLWLARHDGRIFVTGNSGKSGLILGLAFNEHRRSLIMRRKYTDLDGLTGDAMRLFGNTSKLRGGSRPKILTDDERLIEFGAARNVGDEESWQGQPHDLLCFDETVQFAESQYKFLHTWVRTVEKGQRTRILAATNPPTTPQGEWVIKRWKPWLDPNHPNPAKHGELRWFVTTPDGEDMEVDGPEPVEFPGRDKPVHPKSRTFIPGRLKDNPYINSDYESTLDSLPEPFRSAMRDGNFMLSRQDMDNQLIPTLWVQEAVNRWETMKRSVQGVPMCALGVDMVQAGGGDNLCIARRYDGWYDELITIPAKSIKHDSDTASLIMREWRDGADIVIDMGGGYGTHAFIQLEDNGLPVKKYKGVAGTTRRSANGRMVFTNTRSAAYWLFREALDPSQPGGSQVALPNDRELIAELTAPTFTMQGNGIKVENKQDVKDMLGRSPDKADAVVMAWWEGKKGIMPTHPNQVFKEAMGGRSTRSSLKINTRKPSSKIGRRKR